MQTYREVEESQTLLINTQTKMLADGNRKVFRFGFGQSPFLPPEFVSEALRQAVYRKEYSSVQGDPLLREYISAFHKRHNGLQAGAEDILIAPGSKILLFNILLSFRQADVFIPAPAWVSYAPQAKLLGHRIISLQTSFADRWRVRPETLERAVSEKKCKSSVLILNYPGNPDGLTYSAEELRELADIARKNNILVISDEIYGLLDHAGRHLSFSVYYPERTITTTGLSKWCGAGGWRFGAALLSEGIDPELKNALIGIGSETYSCAPVPVQEAAKAAYRDFDKIKHYLDYQTDILKEVGGFCYRELKTAGLQIHAAEGGFYLFPDFSPLKDRLAKHGIKSSTQLCERLLQETGVALLPASAFGFPEDYPAARLAYVDFDEPQNETFELPRHAARVAEGINKMCDWLKAL